MKSRRYYIFKKGGQLETIRTKLAEFGLEVVRLEDIRDDESTPPPSPDGSKRMRSDHAAHLAIFVTRVFRRVKKFEPGGFSARSPMHCD